MGNEKGVNECKKKINNLQNTLSHMNKKQKEEKILNAKVSAAGVPIILIIFSIVGFFILLDYGTSMLIFPILGVFMAIIFWIWLHKRLIKNIK